MSRILYFTSLAVIVAVLLSRFYFLRNHEVPGKENTTLPRITLVPHIDTTAVAIHFDAWKNWRDSYENLLSIPEARYINRVAVSAGRADWTYFRWSGNESWWSSEQSATDTDMLEHTLTVLRERGFLTTAIFDVFGERYLTRYPQAAALDLDGNRSKMIICSTELAEGEAGKHLVQAVEALASTTQADTIAVTELFYDKHCYDDRCLFAYKKATGRTDWPRRLNGKIDYLDPSVGEWRSRQVATIVARLAQVVHAHGKKLAFDVKVSHDDLMRNSVENGQDYHLLAPYVDEFVVWDYFATEDKSPESATPIAAYFKDEFGSDKFYLSIGLWSRNGTISADDLTRALRAAQEGGATQLWITPAEKMSALHWKALADAVRKSSPDVTAPQNQP